MAALILSIDAIGPAIPMFDLAHEAIANLASHFVIGEMPVKAAGFADWRGHNGISKLSNFGKIDAEIG